MTDKQIIIDGVDVSGCCCYENGKCLWTKRYYENNIVPDCKKVKNCYYKNWQRKEQECEDLKEQKHCWECDYEHHREDVYLGRASVCFAKDILQLFEIEEQSNDMENN